MAGSKQGWPAALAGRETGLAMGPPPKLPRPNAGVLILDADTPAAAVPGGILGALQGHEPLHYLDLGGAQAESLAAFGGSDALWGGVTKLYASGSGLASLEGVGRLSRVRYLYVDSNALGEKELLRLLELRPGQLETLDVQGNPGNTDALLQRLLQGGVLSKAEFFNGRRLRDAPR